MSQLTVIGIGNRLRGDDGAGPLVIDRLKAMDHPQLELIDAGSDAIGLLEFFEGRDRVLIVDACQMGKQPGEYAIFTAAEVDAVLDHDLQSLHGLGLSEMLRMGSDLGMLPDDLSILGIQPETLAFQEGLSVRVNAAADRVVAEILADLQEVEVMR